LRELGIATGDVPTQVLGCDAEGMTCFSLGEFITGQAYSDKALALYDPAQRPTYAEALIYDTLRVRSGFLLSCLGHLDQALLQHEVALAEARRFSNPPTLALVLASIGVLGQRVRLEPGLLLQYADELLALAGEHGLGHFQMMGRIERGWCLAALGSAEEGIPLLTAGIVGLNELGYILWRPWALTLLGDTCRMAGQWQAALDHLADARRLAEEREEQWFQAETLRLTGDVLLATGDCVGAEASYREAIVIAQEQSAKLWELRAATSLGRLWHDQGKRAEARDLLAPVYRWFTEGFDAPVLRQAKSLLGELAA
jgi:tetratricopeptide (TPR) repeat protein